ncbi:siderophore-interacting protein [Sphingomonas sp. MG17]|uniref:Siderophore-interacting protein n=1 Tax=Sphingomonas tagetis TaxID=2949092 RepID=A0A9X2HIT4_9SPHN|nr:siderophore-interacting protein [Sphingomonas tagetis]MCP3729899.1 siderophore-interacting protein [Sphingomonas tagetis]
MAPPNRPPPRRLTVLAKRSITPNMLRVTLGGAGLAGFPPEAEGGYVKLRLFPDGGDRLVVRTYTIRHQRDGEIDLDFVLHADDHGRHGPATDWALAAREGDAIEVGGPGPAKPLPAGHARYLIAGDMTALPAISVNLERLPADARGVAVIEVQSDADRQPLAKPDGVEIDWIVNPHPGTGGAAIAERLRAADSGDADIYAWVASEFAAMRALRSYLRDERGLGPDRLYISSYWKAGLSEDEHKIAKRDDLERAGRS